MRSFDVTFEHGKGEEVGAGVRILKILCLGLGKIKKKIADGAF
jgi:hypothetical protein